MRAPDRYLAAALAERPDEDLAAELSCPRAYVWRLRLMGWPRTDHWDADVQLMAAAISADARALGALLRGTVHHG